MAIVYIKSHGVEELPSGIIALSTDVKPTTVKAGSTVYETDTKKIYLFNGTSWIEM